MAKRPQSSARMNAWQTEIGSMASAMDEVLMSADRPLSIDEILAEAKKQGLEIYESRSSARNHLMRLAGRRPEERGTFIKECEDQPGKWIRCGLNTHRIWKIAPGNQAGDWLIFSERGCIGIGWLEDRDFRDFSNVEAILSALEERYGKKAKGAGIGSAEMINIFVHDINIGDIIVANDAYNRAVGIGRVESDYLPATSSKNPLRKDSNTHRHHARLVDWIIRRKAEIPGNRIFEKKTIAKLDDSKVATIQQAYLDQYPGDPELAKQLEELLGIVSMRPTPQGSDQGVVKPERAETTTYRILRDTALARRVKAMHKYRCQICGESINLPDGSRYAEAHHIRPLGGEHEGFDVMDNVLCLCPNHHAECDLGIIKLSLASLRLVAGHQVSEVHLDYHNHEIHGKWIQKVLTGVKPK